MTDCDNHEPIEAKGREDDPHGQAGEHDAEASIESDASGEKAAREALQFGANDAFLYWKRWEAQMPADENGGPENKRKWHGELETLREWFEDQGHWRDLDPNAHDLNTAGHWAHAADKQQIEAFVADRRSRVRYAIDYDDFRVVSANEPHVSKAKDPVAGDWEFVLTGETQLRLRVTGWQSGMPYAESESERVAPEGPPVGYVIFQSADGIHGTVFFANGTCGALDPAFKDARGECPAEYYHVGEYALSRIQKDAVAEDVASIKEAMGTMLPHVRGVPPLLADLDHAKLDKREHARRLHEKLNSIFNPEKQEIYWTLIKCNGVEKHACKEFNAKRKDDEQMSSTTFHRRVKVIRELAAEKENELFIESKSETQEAHKSGGYTDRNGKEVPEEYSFDPQDWTKDPEDRIRIIKEYINASPEECADYREQYPDIDAETEVYQRREHEKNRVADSNIGEGLFRKRGS